MKRGSLIRLSERLTGLCRGLRRLLASNRFFYVVVGLLILQASWIALSGRFPMAYDEQNHIGIVKLYASHISPFWSEQPAGDAPFSAVSRDPSYLYHWLMSFPYRLFDLFWKTDPAKVLAFRFVSIGLFAAGLVLYRKLLLRTGAGKALVHSVLAVFVLIPTVPFVAGQMNYDNLLFPMLAGLLLLLTHLIDQIRAKQLRADSLLLFIGLAMLAGLVKFPFLPILLAMAVWLLVVYGRAYGRTGWRQAISQLKQSFGALSRPLQIGLVLLVLVGGVLFAERYGVNAVRYGTPVPECDQVLDIDRCQAFGPWKRNYDIYQAKIEGRLTPLPPSLSFTYFAVDEWYKRIIWQFFYTLNGPIDGFSVGAPYLLPYYMGASLVLVGAVLAIVYWRHWARLPYLRGLLFVALAYALVLLLQNYLDFLRLHLATAIQARYLVLVLPIILLVLAVAYNAALRRLPAFKPVLVVVPLLVLLTQGGGAGVFIMRSNPTWWWQNDKVVRVNQAAQKVLWRLPLTK